jgi:hypothetical protein
MLAKFAELPRDLPEGAGMPTQQHFWTRKHCPAINVLVVGNHEGRILAVDKRWYGSTHDALIWNTSAIKPLIEENREHLIAADSAFPISDTLMKPFTVEEALNDPRNSLLEIDL